MLKNLSTLILVVESVLEQTHVGCTGSKFSALTLMNLVASTALCRSLVSSSSNVTVITVSAMGKNAALKLNSSADRIGEKSYFNFKKLCFIMFCSFHNTRYVLGRV